MQAFLITKPDCPYCVQAKGFLQGLDITYSESILGTDIQWTEEERETYKTVPQIWIGGRHIGGYDNLVEWSINE